MVKMNQSPLSPSSLISSLTRVAEASSETSCAQALVSAAALLQEAVLSNHPPAEFHAALEAVPANLGAELHEAMNRAVNFHLLEDGGTLGLWLVPVVLSTEKSLPSIIALETQSLNALKMSGCLLQQLSLSPKKSGGGRTGWTYVIPALYGDEQIRSADMGTLIRLPHEAREVVRGSREELSFQTGEEVTSIEGTALYFLPFVAYSPAGFPASLPAASSKTTSRLSQWISETLEPVLGAEFTSHPIQPSPFTLGLRAGDRLLMDVKLRSMMLTIGNQSGVEPNGLAALVAPYATRSSDGAFMIGVSLMARMTQNVVATLALPVTSHDGQEELALTTHILRDMGMVAIQQQDDAISTFACQHCGKVQFAMPNPAFASQGVQECTQHVH